MQRPIDRANSWKQDFKRKKKQRKSDLKFAIISIVIEKFFVIWNNDRHFQEFWPFQQTIFRYICMFRIEGMRIVRHGVRGVASLFAGNAML